MIMAKDAKTDKPVSLTTFVDFVSKAGTPNSPLKKSIFHVVTY